MSYHSAYKGSEIDASVALSETNKEAITTLNAKPAVTKVLGLLVSKQTIAFEPILTGGTDGMVVEVLGAAVGDVVLIGLPAASLGRVWVQGRVIFADNVTIELTNEAGGTATIGSIALTIVVLKV